MLPNYLFDCHAYRTMKAGPRALLLEVVRKYDGKNNGRIGFSARDMAAAINADRETVAIYARELQQRGFVTAVKRGGFNVKAADRRASEWQLNWLAVGETLPTKAFTQWCSEKSDGTEKPATKDGKTVPRRVNGVHHCPVGAENPSLDLSKKGSIGAEIPSTYTSQAIGSANDGDDRGPIDSPRRMNGNRATLALNGHAKADSAGKWVIEQ